MQVTDSRSMWRLPPLPDFFLVLRERLFSSSSWCLGGDVQNHGFEFKVMWFRGEVTSPVANLLAPFLVLGTFAL